MIVLERVARIYAETANCPVDRVLEATKLMEPPTEFADEGGFDSLDRAEFYMAVEEEFSVELPDRKCLDFITIGDVVGDVEAQLREQGRDFTNRRGP
jgi:acyl carrier protein